MSSLIKNTQFNFRTNEDLLEKAKVIVRNENLDMTSLLNSILQKIADEENVPKDFLFEEEQKRQAIIDDLCREIKMGRDDFSNGDFKSLEKVASTDFEN